MNTQFIHSLFSSFQLWIENQLVSDACGAYFTNKANVFSYVKFDDIPSSHRGYQGLYRQLVSDHDISVPNSGVFINGTFTTGSSTGIMIDYNNGRVIVPSGSGTGLSITANSSIREINVYPTEDSEEQILLTNDFIDSSDPNSTYISSKTSKLNEKTFILPAIFLKLESSTNKTFALGGEQETQVKVRAIVLTSNNFLLDGILSFFNDKKHKCFSLIPSNEYPYGKYFTLKSFPYSYDNFSSGYSTKVHIEKIKA